MEEERLPQSNVNKVMNLALPAEASVAKEARQAVSAAGTVFIHYITALAIEVAQKRKKAQVSAEDVLEAVRDAEFNNFIEPLEAGLAQFRSANAAKTKKRKSDIGARVGEDGETKEIKPLETAAAAVATSQE